MVKHAYPHDTQAFTQGLFIKDGALFESTGLKGQSSIRRVQLETGRVLQKKDVPAEFFGEGIAPVGNDIVSPDLDHQGRLRLRCQDLQPEAQILL